jgi:beta-glucosidase
VGGTGTFVIGNEQGPTGGSTPTNNSTSNVTVESLSSNVDDKAMHEIYAWSFVDAIQAGAGSVSIFLGSR